MSYPGFSGLKRIELKPEHRGLGIVEHTLIDNSGANSFPEFVRLEIASFERDAGVYLFRICADGSGTDPWHESLDDALSQAEFEFRVDRSEWRDL